MNGTDAGLPLPRPPSPGNLRAGVARAGTLHGVRGRGRLRSGSEMKGPPSRPSRALALPELPAGPRALRNSRGAAPARPGAGRSRG